MARRKSGQDALAIERAHELERQAHDHHRCVVEAQSVIQIGAAQLIGVPHARGECGIGARQHRVGRVDADEADVLCERVQTLDRFAERASQIDDQRPVGGEVGGELGDLTLHLGVERD